MALLIFREYGNLPPHWSPRGTGSHRIPWNFKTMRSFLLEQTSRIEDSPLNERELQKPIPKKNELLLRTKVCGVCHTDLHIAEGELNLPKLPVVPGHQVVGVVEDTGDGVSRFSRGDRVGVPWLHHTCGSCKFCISGRENLCKSAEFTGLHANGGFAEFMTVHEDFALSLPTNIDDARVAPLLCAGIIGYRSLKLCNIKPGGKLGLIGFGASAHIAIQIAVHWDCQVYAISRTESHKQLAEELGAVWVGSAGEAPSGTLDSVILFAPVGPLVLEGLRLLDKGGTLAINAIHLSPVPEISYDQLYYEKTIRSVANSTRQDGTELLKLAGEIPIRPEVEVFPLSHLNIALLKMKNSELRAAGVIRVDDDSHR